MNMPTPPRPWLSPYYYCYFSHISNRALLSQLLSPLPRLSVVRTHRLAVAAPGDCRRACESARAQSPRPTRGAAKHCENGTRQRPGAAPEHVFLLQLTKTVRPAPGAGRGGLQLTHPHQAQNWSGLDFANMGLHVIAESLFRMRFLTALFVTPPRPPPPRPRTLGGATD